MKCRDGGQKGTIGSLPPSPIRSRIWQATGPAVSKPGQSGNPAGRPKARNRNRPATALIRGAAEDDHSSRRPIGQSVSTTLRADFSADGAGGHAVACRQCRQRQSRAQRLFTELLMSDGTRQQAYSMTSGWRQPSLQGRIGSRSSTAEAIGIEAPARIPHPDHVVIDLEKGGVRITGPMTKQEKLEWDQLGARRLECEAAIAGA